VSVVAALMPFRDERTDSLKGAEHTLPGRRRRPVATVAAGLHLPDTAALG
jgi:hypothetical protein